MAIRDLDHLAEAAEKRAAARKRKGRPRMRVSGAGVKNLQRLIVDKTDNT